MKAVRIHAYGGPEVLRYEAEVPMPEVAADAVLIELVATSVNPIDWKIRSGARQKDFALTLPVILGKDVSGIVRQVGADVSDFAPGERVIALADATYAEFVAVPAALVVRLPEGLDPVDAAAIPLVSLTGDQLVRGAVQAAAGQTILVSGALGSVGRAAVHSARALGARVIAGVRARQMDEAAALGADATVALDDDAAIAALPPLDGVADTVGGDTAARLFAAVRSGGRFGYVSVIPDGVAARYPAVEVARVFARPDPARLLAFARDVADGSFVLPVSQRLPLSEAAHAHAMLERGGGGKIVLLA